MDLALKLSGVSKVYDGFSLQNVNIELPRGCIMGFIGENGAGKSTTIKCIMDLIHRNSGEIQVLGQDVSAVRDKIGVVMDECSFPENLCAKDINSILKRIYKSWNEDEFSSYLKRFELPEQKMVKEYSRGMKMKLSIAAALAHDPELLILDEATSGLDPIVREEILDVFLEFIQDERRAIFVSSHIISDLEKICDYITLIHKGKVMLSDPKDELLDKYVVVKCGDKQLENIAEEAIIGVRRNQFGVQALALRDAIPHGLVSDRATIEDIMLFLAKGDKTC